MKSATLTCAPTAELETQSAIPLVVDLDGTLTPSDTLHESLLKLLRTRPLDALRLPAWLLAGKAAFKREIASRVTLDASLLPYDEKVLRFIDEARAQGRPVLLATAADQRIGRAVAAHLGVFDDVIATSGDENQSGNSKSSTLVVQFGAHGFDYLANSRVDIPVWNQSRTAVLCNVSESLARRMQIEHPSAEVISRRSIALWPLIQAARPYQWVKNILIFVPLVASHLLTWPNFALACLAFLSFSLAASTAYLLNDLADLEDDRRHPRKRNRPFAAGTARVAHGVAAAGLLVTTAGALALAVGPAFALAVLLYFILTMSYSLWLKRYALLDVMLLAGLYTLRIISGGLAVDVAISFWLLGFSMFLFTSLAFAKRYVEVAEHARHNRTYNGGRGYRTQDYPLLRSLGTGTGIASVVTLALYINSPMADAMYHRPYLLWGVCPLLLYWIGRIWLSAERGELTDDPIVFAFTDRVSRALFLSVLVLGAFAY